MTLRHRLAGSVAVLALMQASLAGSAFAQVASGAPGPLVNTQASPALSNAATAPAGADAGTATGSAAENIVVTGSRLKQSNATASRRW